MGTARAEQLRKRLAQGLAARPILRGALRALGAGCFCFVLAGAGLLSEHVPLALAPVCVLPFGPAAVCAYLGAVAGYAVQTMTKQGFSGVVRLMVGFTPEGEVVNVNVLEQTETPGLGTKMADEGNVLLASVKGRKLESKKLVDGKLAVTKDGGDVDALTAATISSRAYVDAINRAWMAYKSVATGEAPTDTASGATAAAGQTNEPAAQEGGQNE